MVTSTQRPVPPTIPPGRIRLSYEEYAELPADGKRYQILDGDLDVTPAPTLFHQVVSQRLEDLLLDYIHQRDLGFLLDAPVDVLLDHHTIVQPDLVFVSTSRRHILTEKNIQGAPDLLVEILSPASLRTDRVVKASLYARFAVPSYWIVDPEARSVEAYALSDAGYTLTHQPTAPEAFRPAIFPDLVIPLEDVFKPIF